MQDGCGERGRGSMEFIICRKKKRQRTVTTYSNIIVVVFFSHAATDLIFWDSTKKDES